jgi:hypothetical protein
MFTLEIDTHGAGFDSTYPEEELADILAHVVNRLAVGCHEGICIDAKGA